MWPFGQRHLEQIFALAPLLDAVVSDVVEKLNKLDRAEFTVQLRRDPNVTVLESLQFVDNNISWRDSRVPGFILLADFGFPWWSLSISGEGGFGQPSFVGIMVTATGADSESTRVVTKAVSVQDYISVKATSAAKKLANILVSQHGYRCLS